METNTQPLIFHDFSGICAWLVFHNVALEIKRNEKNRAIAIVQPSDRVSSLLGQFQGNPTVPLREFLVVQRQLRSLMLAARDEAQP